MAVATPRRRAGAHPKVCKHSRSGYKAVPPERERGVYPFGLREWNEGRQTCEPALGPSVQKLCSRVARTVGSRGACKCRSTALLVTRCAASSDNSHLLLSEARGGRRLSGALLAPVCEKVVFPRPARPEKAVAPGNDRARPYVWPEAICGSVENLLKSVRAGALGSALGPGRSYGPPPNSVRVCYAVILVLAHRPYGPPTRRCLHLRAQAPGAAHQCFAPPHSRPDPRPRPPTNSGRAASYVKVTL